VHATEAADATGSRSMERKKLQLNQEMQQGIIGAEGRDGSKQVQKDKEVWKVNRWSAARSKDATRNKVQKDKKMQVIMYMQQDQEMQQRIICIRIKRFNMETGAVSHEFQVLMEASGSRDTRRKLMLSVWNFKW
jgi:hypothetical protein